MNIQVKSQSTSTGSLPQSAQSPSNSALGASFGSLLSSLQQRLSLPLPDLETVDIPKPIDAPKASATSDLPADQPSRSQQSASSAVCSQPKDPDKPANSRVQANASEKQDTKTRPTKEKDRAQPQRQVSEPTVNSPTLLVLQRPDAPLQSPVCGSQQELSVKSGQTQSMPQGSQQPQPNSSPAIDSLDFGLNSSNCQLTTSHVDAMQRAVGQAASLPDSQSKAASVQSSPTQTSSAPSALSSLTPTIDSPAIQSTTAQGGSLIADNSKVALAAMSIPVAVRQQATSPASKDEKLISPDSERSSDAANLHRADSSSFAVQNAAPEKSVSMPVQRDSRSHQQSALSEQAQYSEPSEANRSQPSAGERAPMASASTVQQPNVSSQSQPSAATAYAASAAVEHQTQADRPLAPAQSVDSLQSTAPIKSPAVNGVPIAESLPTATQSDGVSQKADATTSARFEDAAAKLEKLSDVLDQVRSIAVSGEKKADVDVHLEMGRVQIHVEVDGKSVSVNFAADNASLEHALRQRLPELQRSLSENGFSMGNTTFHGQGMAQGQGGGFRENFREPVQQQAAFEESRNPKTSSSQASVATPPDASTIDNGRLYVVA